MTGLSGFSELRFMGRVEMKTLGLKVNKYQSCKTRTARGDIYFFVISRSPSYLDNWLTVLHRSITLFDPQIDAQNSYLFVYNTFIKNPLHVSSITLLIFRRYTS